MRTVPDDHPPRKGRYYRVRHGYLRLVVVTAVIASNADVVFAARDIFSGERLVVGGRQFVAEAAGYLGLNRSA